MKKILKEIEEDLSQMKRGFLLKFKDKTFNNYQEVLEYATTYNTILQLNPTYYKSGGLQCKCDIGRGISDLWRICKFYFPETTLEDVVTYFKNTDLNYRIQYCGDTNQTVIRLETYSKCIKPTSIAIRKRNFKNVKIEW